MIFKGKIGRDLLKKLNYPVVLKQPDGSFSRGVFKISGEDELREKVRLLAKTSEVIIAQEYIETGYDWRIGIFDVAPLFACKYYMAEGRWQIYNWGSPDEKTQSGPSETLPVTQVPAHVLSAAVKAANTIGDGLYGVDLKEKNGKVFIIEINDNPNIDAGIEDEVLKDELYLKIMRSFYNRIERERNVPRLVS